LQIHPRKLAVFFALFLTQIAFAEGTRTWEQSKFEELTKGTANGVAIRSTGGLELAPAFKSLYTAPSTYIWSIASDDAGDIYAAAGAPARVYRITPDGQATTIFEPTELQVQSLIVDKNGVVYAGTAPDGKVYKIEKKGTSKGDSAKSNPPDKSKGQVDPAWTSSVYFDPGTKYIWDLTFDGSGNLYVATGDRGEIFKVSPKGDHSVFFKSDEAHIRVLALDPKGNLIAGSDGSGLVYRIAPSGEAFVLYSAPKKEITALALDAAGNIYAAGVGEKRPGPNLMPGFGQPAGSNPSASPGMVGPAPGIVITPTQPSMSPMMNFPAPGAGATGGSEIYRIAPDGSPTRMWGSREDIVYALAFDPQGRLLAGTGNRGHIFAMKSDDDFSDLLKVGASQVTAFAKAPGGGLYASGSNLGKIFVLGPAPQTEGSYESDVFDAKIFSRWGRAEFRGAGNVELFARSGNVDNPDRNWSPWKKVDTKDGETGIPPARFVQWKAILHSGSPAPRVDNVTLNYLSKNVAPDIDDVGVQTAVRYQPMPKLMGGTPDMSGGAAGLNPSQPRFEPPVPTVHDRESMGVKWVAHDDNDDQLVYSLYYRGDGETRWLLLKDGLTDKFYSFDASLLPDGGYTFKVVASDAPSHSPGEELTAEKESARVEVDTTAPHIENLNAATEGDKIHVTFRAVDGFSPIKRSEYSIDANDWQYVEPVGQIADAKTESYDFKVSIPADSLATLAAAAKAKKNETGQLEHVVVVRVYDRFDNMSGAKTVIRGK
jgi:outer membrane protein assembly factor BamB